MTESCIVAAGQAAAVIADSLTRADAPLWGRAWALAGSVIYAVNHPGMPCTMGLSSQNQLLTVCCLAAAVTSRAL